LYNWKLGQLWLSAWALGIFILGSPFYFFLILLDFFSKGTFFW
jgi:uncharacterized membrane protein